MTARPPPPIRVPPAPQRAGDLPTGRAEGVVFMATGAALVVHILWEVPLWLAVVTTVGLAAAVLVLGARRHPFDRAGGREVIVVGAGAAGAALLAYDGSRVLLTAVLDYEVRPFAAFPHFGAGLIGSTAPEPARWIAGTAFHVVNAITFGIAYTVVAGAQPTRRRGVMLGIAFGLGLEAVMLGFYPAWLQIPNLREFASMSIVGHVAYGATLGVLAQRGLDRLARRRAPPTSTGPMVC